MLPLKINHITNLADARYCAALDMAAISLSVGRGSVYKIDRHTAKEITQWLSGPLIVYEFGDDIAGYQDLTARYPQSCCQVSVLPTVITPPSAAVVWYSVRLTDEQPLKHWLNTAPAILPNYTPVLELEFMVSPATISTELLAAVCRQFSCWYNIDMLNWSAVEQLTGQSDILPEGLAARRAVQKDLLEIDYDKIELLITQMNEQQLFAYPQ
jgi:hypothetical protein